MKICTRCGVNKPIGEFHRNRSYGDGRTGQCRSCRNEFSRIKRLATPGCDTKYAREWRKANPDRYLDQDLRTRNGISAEQYEALLARQGNSCAVCGSCEPGSGRWRVDHDHSCCSGRKSCGGCVRGLLCHKCNVALGLLGDSPAVLERAALYLSKSQTDMAPSTLGGS